MRKKAINKGLVGGVNLIAVGDDMSNSVWLAYQYYHGYDGGIVLDDARVFTTQSEAEKFAERWDSEGEVEEFKVWPSVDAESSAIKP